MKTLIRYISLFLFVAGLSSILVGTVTQDAIAAPIDVIQESCDRANQANSEFCQGTPDPLFGDNGLFMKIINAIIFVIGAVAVVMIVIGGFRYVVSGGDSSAVTSAKNTILYAIVGLVVAILSFAIVNFVIRNF